MPKVSAAEKRAVSRIKPTQLDLFSPPPAAPKAARAVRAPAAPVGGGTPAVHCFYRQFEAPGGFWYHGHGLTSSFHRQERCA